MGVMSRIVVVLICLAGAQVGFSEEKVEAQLKQLEARQLELTKQEIQAYKASLEKQISDSKTHFAQSSMALENKIGAIDNRVDLRLGLWGLIVLALGAVIGFLAGVKWKTREVEKIFETEAAAFRNKIRNDVIEVFSSEDQDLQAGLDASIKRSVQRLKHEKSSKILIVTGEQNNDLEGLLPRLGFDKSKFNTQAVTDVFDGTVEGSSPQEQGYDLVILDSLTQKDAYHFIEAGGHQGYLLYNDGAPYKFGKDTNGQPHPYQFDRNKTVIANSKPAVYGHVMTLLSFNGGG